MLHWDCSDPWEPITVTRHQLDLRPLPSLPASLPRREGTCPKLMPQMQAGSQGPAHTPCTGLSGDRGGRDEGHSPWPWMLTVSPAEDSSVSTPCAKE